jgi:Prokaryotic Cytochrome C oxidase subunit IV
LFSPAIAVVGTFLIAGLKVRYVMLDFMELRFAPLGARVLFQVWIVAVVALILGLWFAT